MGAAPDGARKPHGGGTMENKPKVKVVYKQLQERLDKYPVGAPARPELFEILELLFGEEHARVAAKMPMKPAPLDKISKRTGVSEDKLRRMFEEMASRGLVMDFPHQKTGKTFYMLTPTVVGFFEFSLMQERDDFPQKRVAELMDKLSYPGKGFFGEIFREHTQIGRVVPHETALDEEQRASLPAADSATKFLETAGTIALSHCYCRHKARLMDHACGRPEEICLSLGPGTEYLIRNGLANAISLQEGLDLLAKARDNGLVHIADNILDGPTFLCNCCGCCCGMLQAINKKGLTHAVHTSGFVADVDEDECKGCKKCAERCPIGAITMFEETGEDGRVACTAVVDESVCLGCGVCVAACKSGSMLMSPRAKRTLTPENTLERVLSMAIERGKLHHFLFDDAEGPTAEFLKTLTGAFLNMPLPKRILLNKEVRSRFLDFASRA
jgi:Na+-translocating ferredoxin:NAD+ oxidoreductase RNF subunit RnfB